ncbi:MAG TPA: hypothetical protein VFS21_37325 [Roseiflexaceae bacterium]|nr:hypothetical protein [Roseiflexaceae bacterium]
MYIAMQYYLFDDATIDAFWNRVIECLSNEDEAIARPVAFMIWIDFFEHPNYDEFSWRKLGRTDLNKHVIRRVLGISGPIPFKLKESFYRGFIRDKKWYQHIFEGLYGSAFDMFGKIDKIAALDIFRQLELDHRDSRIVKLENFLAP